MRDIEDWPIFTMDGKRYSFLDCTCDSECKKTDCLYCQWMKEDCPGAEAD